ncbi:MAG: TetR/AcrR family transcriptional regulator [Thermodesulfovibrionales bacterium]
MNKRSSIESKKRIRDAAVRVFSKYGYRGASMRMIASAAGISVGGIYLYFKNKEDLYLSLMKERLSDFNQKLTVALKHTRTPSEAFNVFITLYLNNVKKHREFILIQGREHRFAFGINIKRRFFRHQRKVIEGIIQEGIASGEFRKCNVKEVSKIIFCALRGFILSLIIEPEALFSPEECSSLILNGLLENEKPN